MDYSIDPIERSQLDPHFDELVGYINAHKNSPNLGFLLKIHLKSKNLTICTSIDPVPIHIIFPDTRDVNIDVSQTQVIMGRNSLVTDVYPMTSGNYYVDTLEHNIISDSAQIEILMFVMDVLRTCSICSWTSEPYHQNQI